jgi:hypothetical protein
LTSGYLFSVQQPVTGSSSFPAAGKLTSGNLFSNLSPVKFTSCYKEVDFQLPVQQPFTGQAHFLLQGS